MRLVTPWGSLWFIHCIVKFSHIIFHKSVFIVEYHYSMLQRRKELEKFMTDVLDGNLLIAAT